MEDWSELELSGEPDETHDETCGEYVGDQLAENV